MIGELNMNDIDERRSLYFLMSTGLFSNNTLKKLRDVYGSYHGIYAAHESRLSSDIKENVLPKLTTARQRTDIEYEYSRLADKQISFVMYEDDDYPERFRQLSDAPRAILVRGRLPLVSIPSVAIIGARNCSNYGRSMTREYASLIAKCGIQVISGMAMGIDGIAGQAALDNGGDSFAVLGSGPDICYPSCNQNLYDNLVSHGGIISEYTLGTPGVGWHFPMRNRLISALSDAVIVIEAKEKSGTMITVDSALEQGKDIYALPGRGCDLLSRGCNRLIRQGAGILTSPEDFISEFITGVASTPEYSSFISSFGRKDSKEDMIFDSPHEKIIYDSLDHDPQSLDDIYARTCDRITLTFPEIMVCLNDLCIKGLATNICGTYYARK